LQNPGACATPEIISKLRLLTPTHLRQRKRREKEEEEEERGAKTPIRSAQEQQTAASVSSEIWYLFGLEHVL
jgi:hypothetical protein